ncbi:MAG: amino acid ABC transporter substrate-binding protein [Chloroflexaceae bacterium]|nr:amino acid ABC transporter substrate-binding protein [Chloroflexaceae bacterium]
MAPTPPPDTRAPLPGAPDRAPDLRSRLHLVQQRGELICGVHGELPGFSLRESDGSYSGFDADFCRVIALAVLGDADAVSFRSLDTQERFQALRDGEIDVLLRNSSWNLSRDITEGLDFGPVIFYDSQGILTLEDNLTNDGDLLPGEGPLVVCVQTATTSEQHARDFLQTREVDYDLAVFDNIDAMYAAYENGECDAVTADWSGLQARRLLLDDPVDHGIVPIPLLKEPLAPVVQQGDSSWRDAVSWAIFVTIQAEEFGITSSNVSDFFASERPRIRTFLGLDGSLWTDLGLEPDTALLIIEQMGNYGEMYERNLGPETPLGLERGLNALWIDGGLLYAPSFE